MKMLAFGLHVSSKAADNMARAGYRLFVFFSHHHGRRGACNAVVLCSGRAFRIYIISQGLTFNYCRKAEEGNQRGDGGCC